MRLSLGSSWYDFLGLWSILLAVALKAGRRRWCRPLTSLPATASSSTFSSGNWPTPASSSTTASTMPTLTSTSSRGSNRKRLRRRRSRIFQRPTSKPSASSTTVGFRETPHPPICRWLENWLVLRTWEFLVLRIVVAGHMAEFFTMARNPVGT